MEKCLVIEESSYYIAGKVGGGMYIDNISVLKNVVGINYNSFIGSINTTPTAHTYVPVTCGQTISPCPIIKGKVLWSSTHTNNQQTLKQG